MKYQNDRVKQYRLGSLPEAPIPALAKLARESAGEGMVLVKNDNGTLPLISGDKISLFGRAQREYCKSGTGSGGLVHVEYVTNILESLQSEHPDVVINETLLHIYETWLQDNPFDRGKGWAQEPWCQVEMPVTDEMVMDAARVSDKAVVVLSRTAGEDKDNSATPGSWYLTETEDALLATVSRYFSHVAVVLNVGNIIDMTWVEKYGIDSVLYAWQGGMEGGAATADVLCGTVNPSGKLTDTIARIEDYPCEGNFGDPVRNYYTEDIYVGYRYFETFAQDKVLYPFGLGLSYTTFDVVVDKISMTVKEDAVVTVKATVTNTGTMAGKEVVQVYLGAPQGKLGKPEKTLVAFSKTPLLQPGESDTLKISFHLEEFASYDDSGVTGHKSCFVLEEGQYLIYVGTDVRHAEAHCAFFVEEKVVESCHEALSPILPFERMRPDAEGNLAYEPAPTRTYNLHDRIRENRPVTYPYSGDQGIKLVDVRDGRASMEDFIAQFTDDELFEICRGEGMGSPKVTPGTGGCLGGVSDGLLSHGVPIACVTDGPSGIRLDGGMKATSLPNGTLLACTWNLPLVEELFVLEGVEMTAYKIDALLGPGINIHRSPLNGRNFEYCSEDPYLTGMMAAAMCRGVKKCGVCCTIKHFACNNQEFKRHETDSVLSERAAREIYLRPFEIAIKVGEAEAIMTSYNFINGNHGASNYDLCTTILREEWGYDGFVMSDWWAQGNEEGGESSVRNLSYMIRSQNDVFMLDSVSHGRQDDAHDALQKGIITRGEAQRCAINLCRYLMHTHAMERYLANGSTYSSLEDLDVSEMIPVPITLANDNGRLWSADFPKDGKYAVVITYHADTAPLAQISISVEQKPHKVGFCMVQGTDGATCTAQMTVTLKQGAGHLRFNTNNGALKIDNVALYVEK